MLRIQTLAWVILALLAARTAQAAEPAKSEASVNSPTSGLLWDKPAAVEPAAGLIVFKSPDGTTTRPIAGFYLKGDFSKALPSEAEMTFLGLQGGFLYSYLGSFASAGLSGANVLFVPFNLVLGWNTSPWSRISAHGGGTFVHRTVSGSMLIDGGYPSSGPETNIFVNVGMDFEASIRKNMGFVLRPDVTFTPGNDIYGVVAGLTFKFG